MDDLEKKRRHDLAVRKWQKANHAKIRQAARALYARKREKFLEAGKKWREDNRDKSRKSARNWQARNKEKCKADHAAWRRKNSHIRSAKQSKRKASALKATPAWANDFFIKEAYHLAAMRTKMLGFPWHVDHIVPLQSPIVCGLHWEKNLQVIPAVKNIAKHNKHWPDMP